MTDIHDHAKRWTTLITTDTDATVDLYHEDLVYDDRRDIDHVHDTPTNKAALRDRISVYANTDPHNGQGIHHFEVLDVLESVGHHGTRAVAILWRWTGEHLAAFRGVPTDGKPLTARGQTWHELDAEGRIVRESTYWNDVPAFQSLGLPVVTPEYWVEGFDPSSLIPS